MIYSRIFSWLLILLQEGYLVNSMEITMEMWLFLFLVLGKSLVIDLRESYNDNCRRKNSDGL
jgi:hypothetical protein